MGYIILGIIIGLVISYFAAIEFASIASEKGYDDSKYFWYTFLLGIIGMLMVIALPDRGVDHSSVHKNIDKVNSFVDKNISTETIGNVYNSKNKIEKIDDQPKLEVENDKNIPAKAIIRDGQMICPVCGKVQVLNRKKCWDCGQAFEE